MGQQQRGHWAGCLIGISRSLTANVQVMLKKSQFREDQALQDWRSWFFGFRHSSRCPFSFLPALSVAPPKYSAFATKRNSSSTCGAKNAHLKSAMKVSKTFAWSSWHILPMQDGKMDKNSFLHHVHMLSHSCISVSWAERFLPVTFCHDGTVRSSLLSAKFRRN